MYRAGARCRLPVSLAVVAITFMKFVFVKREPLSRPDGISQFIFAVADALLGLGHQVACLTTHDEELEAITRIYDFSRYPQSESLCPPSPPNAVSRGGL